MQMGYPSTGYANADPSAIPPPGMYHLQRAGVVVNAHTLLQVDVVYTSLRIISNNILRMGNLLPFAGAGPGFHPVDRSEARDDRG
jgi:hypothetical protein